MRARCTIHGRAGLRKILGAKLSFKIVTLRRHGRLFTFLQLEAFLHFLLVTFLFTIFLFSFLLAVQALKKMKTDFFSRFHVENHKKVSIRTEIDL